MNLYRNGMAIGGTGDTSKCWDGKRAIPEYLPFKGESGNTIGDLPEIVEIFMPWGGKVDIYWTFLVKWCSLDQSLG